jgi:hypothetical protein
MAATVEQAAGAENWTVIRAERPASNGSILSASLVREVQLRKASKDAPLYRLNMTCDETSRQGEIQLTWSPEPQTNRTFWVSVDGKTGLAHRLAGQEKMGNGTAGTSGRASAILLTPLPTKSISITDLFERETVVFPVDALDRRAWQVLAACFQRN